MVKKSVKKIWVYPKSFLMKFPQKTAGRYISKNKTSNINIDWPTKKAIPQKPIHIQIIELKVARFNNRSQPSIINLLLEKTEVQSVV